MNRMAWRVTLKSNTVEFIEADQINFETSGWVYFTIGKYDNHEVVALYEAGSVESCVKVELQDAERLLAELKSRVSN